MKYLIVRDEKEIPVEILEKAGGYTVTLDGKTYDVDSLVVVPGLYSMVVEGASYEVTVFRPEPDLYHVHLYDGMRPVELVHPSATLYKRKGARGGGAGVVKAPMPGKVVRVLAKVGDTIEKGGGLVVLEAMKMQNELQAARSGKVVEISVSEGESVNAGQVLMKIGEE